MKQASSWLDFSNVVSVVALIFSVLAVFLDLYSVRRATFPPEVFSRTFELTIHQVDGSDEFSMSAKLVFSVSNRSSEPIFVLGCRIHFEGAGAGPHSESGSLPAECLELDSDGPIQEGLEVAPGQTIFRRVFATVEVSRFGMEGFLESHNVKFEVPTYLASLAAEPCRFREQVDAASTFSIGSNCEAFWGKSIVSVEIVSGSGEKVLSRNMVGESDGWPWGPVGSDREFKPCLGC